jgi:hypothetical protein
MLASRMIQHDESHCCKHEEQTVFHVNVGEKMHFRIITLEDPTVVGKKP